MEKANLTAGRLVLGLAATLAVLALWLALPHWLKKADEQQDGPGEAEAEERRQVHV